MHRDFSWYWSGGDAEALCVLPARRERPVADLEHMTLQLLSLVAAILTVRAAVHAWSRETTAV